MQRLKETQLSSGHLLLVVAAFAIAFSTFMLLSNIFKPSITGAETAYANVTINQSIGITLITDGVNFTSAGPYDYRESNRSADIESGDRINMTNIGNVPINVTVQTTTDLFTSVNPGSDSSFKCMIEICNGIVGGSNGDTPGQCLPSPWNNTYTDCDSSDTSSPVPAIANLTFLDGSDSAVLDISITIPSQESGGLKQATLSLVASASGL